MRILASLAKRLLLPPISTLDRFYGITKSGDDSLWAVGNFGKVIHSADGGDSWAIQTEGQDINLQSIAAWDASRAVVVGDRSTVMVTADGGGSWEQIEGLPVEQVNKLISVKAFPNGEAWAIGERGTIIKSDDYGKHWQRMRDSEDVGLQGFSRVDEKVWVVGEFGTILYSADAGNGWVKQVSGTQSYLEAVAFRDASHGVAVGLDGLILATDDGGESWQKAVSSPVSNHYFAVAWNGTNWLVAGSKGVIATANKAADQWQLSKLGENNFSWHVQIVPLQQGWLLAGSDIGIYSDVGWQELSSSNTYK